MTRMTKYPIHRCRTVCGCGTCGLPVRLVPAEFEPGVGRTFSVKAGDALLLSLCVYPAGRPREEAVLIGDLSGRLPLSQIQRLSPEDAIRFVKSLGLPYEFFWTVLADLGWIKSPACADCGGPAYKRLPCGHPLCEDCRQVADDYADIECSTCDGSSVPCRLATMPPNVPLGDLLKAVYLRCKRCGWRGPSSEATGYIGQPANELACPQCNHYGTVNEVVPESPDAPGEPPDGWLETDHDEPPDYWLEAAYESRTELDD